MNPALVTTFAPPDPNASPLNLTQLFQLAGLLVHTSFAEGTSYIPYVRQNGTPSVDDQDKAWIELDTQGRPINIKVFWSGHWRRVYNGMLGEIRGYTGNPSSDFTLPEGLGKIGLTYDGWHICNGKGGTPDLSDQFLIGAHMNDKDHAGYDNGWVTWVNKKSETTGGVNEQTLVVKQIPRDPTTGFKMDKYHAGSENTNEPGGLLYGTNSVQHIEIVPADPGNTKPDPVNIIPPFYTLAWITFVGYAS